MCSFLFGFIPLFPYVSGKLKLYFAHCVHPQIGETHFKQFFFKDLRFFSAKNACLLTWHGHLAVLFGQKLKHAQWKYAKWNPFWNPRDAPELLCGSSRGQCQTTSGNLFQRWEPLRCILRVRLTSTINTGENLNEVIYMSAPKHTSTYCNVELNHT